MNIGAAIKRIRKSAGIKSKDLAKFCSISPAFLSQLESNKRETTISTYIEIAAALNVPFLVLVIESIEPADFETWAQDSFEVTKDQLSKNFKFLSHAIR